MRRRKKYILWGSLAAVLVLLVVLYASLNRIVLHFVNDTLEDGLHGYSGHIGDLDLDIFQGGYHLENIEIYKVDVGEETPFFASDAVHFTLLWKALFDGQLSGEVKIVRPEVLFIHGSDESETQGGEDGDWLGVIRELTPFNLGRGEVVDGTIIFRNTRGDELREIAVTDFHLVAENLSNYKDAPGEIVGGIRARGLLANEAPMEASISIDPMAENLYLDANFRIRELSLVSLAPITRSYANFDFEQGEADVAAELAVRDQQIRGYIKPVLTNVIVGRFEGDIEEDRDGPIIFTWENLVGLFTFFLQEKSIERFATIVPITGQLDSPNVDIWESIGNAFENAYGESIESGLENNTNLKAGFEEDPDAYLKKLERAVDDEGEGKSDADSSDDQNPDEKEGEEDAPQLPHRDDNSPPNRPV